ncbi:carboxy terminal-processing peptidase [Oligella ureolytica]
MPWLGGFLMPILMRWTRNGCSYYYLIFEGFHPHRLDTAKMISHGELEMAFDIYTLYRERVQEYYQYVFSLLDSEHEFDFTKDELFSLDRKKLPWLELKAELQDLWRQRVKNDFLRLKLVDRSDEEIIERLRKRYINSQKLILQANSEDVAEMFLNAYADSTDPHTSYFSPTSAKNFNVQLSLSVEGIGAVLQKRDEYAQIREVVAGGPAEKSGHDQAGRPDCCCWPRRRGAAGRCDLLASR